MSSWLPQQYNEAKDYFDDVIMFLNEYKWVFNWSVTHILIENAIINIPPEWLSVFELLSDADLNELHSGRCEDDWPSSLKRFLSVCQNLRLPIETHEYKEPNLSTQLRKGLSPKKEHEVIRLAALINSECAKSDVKFVLDIGSGLGYLCEVLHFEYGYNILGLESDPKRTARAVERHKEFQKAVNIESTGKVEYATCHLSEDSVKEVESELLKACGNSSTTVCMVGLHACGDLTPSAMHLFDQISQVKSLIILPCCYHRKTLKSSNEEEDIFVKFPVSDSLREAVTTVEERCNCRGSHFLRRPLLRLAAQRSSSAWEKMEENFPNERLYNTLATASLYLLAHKGDQLFKVVLCSS